MNKIFLSLIIIFVFSTKSYSENLKFTKIVKLKNPWSASFINNNEVIITEKEGKIKIVNLSSKEIFNINHDLNYLVHGQGGLLGDANKFAKIKPMLKNKAINKKITMEK